MSEKLDIQHMFDCIISQESIKTHFSNYREEHKKYYAKIFEKSIVAKHINESKNPEDTFNNILNFLNLQEDFKKLNTDKVLAQMLMTLKTLKELDVSAILIKSFLDMYKKNKTEFESFQAFIQSAPNFTLDGIQQNILNVKLPDSVVDKYKKHLDVYMATNQISKEKLSKGVLHDELVVVVNIHNAEIKKDIDTLKSLVAELSTPLQDLHKNRLYEQGLILQDEIELVNLSDYLIEEGIGSSYNLTTYLLTISEEHGQGITTLAKEELNRIILLVDDVINTKHTTSIPDIEGSLKKLEDSNLTQNTLYTSLRERYKSLTSIDEKYATIANKIKEGQSLTKEESDFLGIPYFDDYIPSYLIEYLKSYADDNFKTIQKYDLQQGALVVADVCAFIKNMKETTPLEELEQVRNKLKTLEGTKIYSILSLDLTELEFYIQKQIQKKELEEKRLEDLRKKRENRKAERLKKLEEKNNLLQEKESTSQTTEVTVELKLPEQDVIKEQPFDAEVTDQEMHVLLGKKEEHMRILDVLYGELKDLESDLIQLGVTYTFSNVDFYTQVLQDLTKVIAKKAISESDAENMFMLIDKALEVSTRDCTMTDFTTLASTLIRSSDTRDAVISVLVSKLKDLNILPIKTQEKISLYDLPVHTTLGGKINPIRQTLESDMVILPHNVIDDAIRLEIDMSKWNIITASGKDYYGISTDDVIIRISKDVINLKNIIEDHKGTLILTLLCEYGVQYDITIKAQLPNKLVSMDYAKKPVQVMLLKQTQDRAYHKSKTGVHSLLQKEVNGINTVFMYDIVPFTMRKHEVHLADIKDSPVPLEVEVATELALISPIDAQTFHCLGNVTKKQAFVWIAKALGHINKDSLNWYKSSLDFLESRGVVDSFVKENYELNSYLLRQELCYLLNNLYTLEETLKVDIQDIDQATEVYKGALLSIIQKGVVPLANDNKISPKEYVSREEMAYYLTKLRNYMLTLV